jgi:DNA-damage-inducible protein J
LHFIPGFPGCQQKSFKFYKKDTEGLASKSAYLTKSGFCYRMVLNATNSGVIMAQVNIRIDDDLKIKGERLFKELGLTFSSAVSVFVSQAVRERAIPFKPTADPFYSESNVYGYEASPHE